MLIDFGIARHLDAISLTSSFAMFGPMTIGYCAPEQINNQKRAISIRTDLFALGIVCTNGDWAATLRGRLYAGAARCLPDVSSISRPHCHRPRGTLRFTAFVRDCLEKAPHRRPAQLPGRGHSLTGFDWS